jgi:hypothetical protein
MTTSVQHGRPSRKPEVWVRRAGHENAVYAPGSSEVYQMNESALAIWHLCDGNTSPQEMVEAICEISNMHPDVVQEDVARILADFERAGLIEWRG